MGLFINDVQRKMEWGDIKSKFIEDFFSSYQIGLKMDTITRHGIEMI